MSGPHLAVFLADGVPKRLGPIGPGNYSKPGEVADGPRESINAFWFDALSGWFGCDNHGPEDCRLEFTAYAWNPNIKTEDEVTSFNATIPACDKTKGCGMHLIAFPHNFISLTGLQIQAFVDKDERMFFVDDLSMSWSNNSCAAGLLRQSSM